ncbi:flavin-containing monooxygenase [Actinocorallia populi]|uniref:flavin-containing monooxygenase n=1 Tax=Actinocorallia populi TaxID=2079200 RepID=UPI000D08B702|nr:NAD(P)/FAD-dependent oxidoreductase [Actinocorallia populi]
MTSNPHRLIDLRVAPRRLPADELERSLAAADTPLLLLCLVQVTGDVSLLDRFGTRLRYEQTGRKGDSRAHPVGRLPEEDLAELKKLLVEALTREPDGEYLQVPDDALFHRMVRLATGADVGEEFVGSIREQAGFEPSRHTVECRTDPPADFKVAVLGAGMTGIAAAIACADNGFSYEIFERGDDIGGTWRINTYPGIAVDTPSVYYSLSFEQEAGWSRQYPVGDEYQRYLQRVVDKYGLRPNIRFGTEIKSLVWDDGSQEWEVTCATADGGTVTSRANAVITATGFLNSPKYPDLPGRETFAGPSIHTAAWDHSLDLAGKRVGVIGAGATSVQVVDAIAGDVAHLTLFQRQPHWVLPNTLGEGLVSEQERWLKEHLPFYGRWLRAKSYWYTTDTLYPGVRADKEWMASHPLSISEANDRVLQMCLGHLEASFGNDPELRRKMTPDFPVHGKRIVRDPGGYYAALASDRADVVTDRLARVVPQGIETEDGTLVELDVIIYATGFTLEFLSPVEIVGRGGARLADQWAGGTDPRSYLGGTVPNFPNLFVTSGPNSSSGHGGGHNFMTEVVVHYITQCLRLLVERGARSIEVTREAQDEFVAAVDAQMEGSIWRNSPKAHTYYRNASGRVMLPNPWRMVDYWRMSRTPDESKFVIR